MIEQDWRRRIDRLASYYRHGIYTALEVQSTAAPELSEESQRLFRLKMAALRALFESEETTNQRH